MQPERKSINKRLNGLTLGRARKHFFRYGAWEGRERRGRG